MSCDTIIASPKVLKRIMNDDTVDRDSDLNLIQACRRGDNDAWENVLQRYERLVYFIPLSQGLSVEDAADVVQHTFTALLQSLDSLRDDSHLGGWLCTVARRQAWRLKKRGQLDGLDVVDADAIRESAGLLGRRDSDHIERWEMANWLNNGLTQLGDRCRELLIALYFEDEQPSYADLALRLNISTGSIGPTRARCLEKLRRVLQRG